MDADTVKKLKQFVKKRQDQHDPSHDFQHVLRVTNLARRIASTVDADEEIVIPAALFHDIVVYQKDTEASKNESKESAEIADNVLSQIDQYPKEKISEVKICIKECSFSKGKNASSIESKVLQDADRLEATGAISIMRTFASCADMDRPFYPPEDPLCRSSVETYRSGINLFRNRLLKVQDVLHTDLAKQFAQERAEFLEQFLDQLEHELHQSDVM
jgi:uncharacterized protein